VAELELARLVALDHAELARHVSVGGEPYDGGKLHLQHLRSKASSTVCDVREKQ